MASDRHPHEPLIPPVFDAEGRCIVCQASVLVKAIRHSLNQLTDHGSQKCLDCLKHRQDGMDAVAELEQLFAETVTKATDLPHNRETTRMEEL